MIPKKQDIRLLLDDIRSVHNVGSIFRTAETLGISMVYCWGTTPTPLDRFGRKRSDFAKVALGAEDFIKWEYVADQSNSVGNIRVDSANLVKKLKKEGFIVIALEQAKNSVDYKEVTSMIGGDGSKLSEHLKVLVILGAEVDGVSPDLLELSDVIAEIPLKGKKESLNVSVAAGIFLYRLLDG